MKTTEPKMKRFHKTSWGWDIRCFGGFLVCYNRDVFCIWWSTDATPPTKREGNGRWIIGSYGKWASSIFA